MPLPSVMMYFAWASAGTSIPQTSQVCVAMLVGFIVGLGALVGEGDMFGLVVGVVVSELVGEGDGETVGVGLEVGVGSRLEMKPYFIAA